MVSILLTSRLIVSLMITIIVTVRSGITAREFIEEVNNMTFRITLVNRETETRISKRFQDPTADDITQFLDKLELFGEPGSLTDWDVFDIHNIVEEVTSA